VPDTPRNPADTNGDGIIDACEAVDSWTKPASEDTVPMPDMYGESLAYTGLLSNENAENLAYFHDWSAFALTFTPVDSFAVITTGHHIDGTEADTLDYVLAVVDLAGPLIGTAVSTTGDMITLARQGRRLARAGDKINDAGRAARRLDDVDEAARGTRYVDETTEAGRLPQDVNVNPDAPDRLRTDRPIGNSRTQNARLQNDIEVLRSQGAKDIRVNQHQVDVDGRRVGINRPDLQYTLDRKRYYVEYETTGSGRGPGHERRIRANDPNGEVTIIIQD
jgi:hypothetical protein